MTITTRANTSCLHDQWSTLILITVGVNYSVILSQFMSVDTIVSLFINVNHDELLLNSLMVYIK